MAIIGIDNRIPLAKSQDASAESLRLQQQINQQQGALHSQLQTEAARDTERPTEVSEAEDARIGADDRRGQPGSGEEQERRRHEEEFREEVSAATERMLNLPVEHGRFAVREERRIDIIV
jgi:hypothetical protein